MEKVKILLFLILCFFRFGQCLDILSKLYLKSFNESSDVFEDSFLTVPEMIEKYGYPIEVYKIITKDGYILELHRIINKGRQPALLWHGLLDSSAAYIILGPKKSLGYILWDLGYDIWLGNSRGSRYSRNHTTLDPDGREFWEFSWHEMAIYDLPATIDFITKETKFERLFYVGHSQGTTSFFIMASQLPKYQKRIIQMHALAPVVYLTHVRGAIACFFQENMQTAIKTTHAMGIHELFPNLSVLRILGQTICRDNSTIQSFCSNLLFLIGGFNPGQMNKSLLPVIFGHIPSGSSMRQLIHYGQVASTGKFRQFDFGHLGNMARYQSLDPPYYDLSNVRVKTYLYYGENDYLSGPDDVIEITKILPNIVQNYKVPLDGFNHFDFIWAIDIRQLVYNQLIDNFESEKQPIK